MHHSCGIKSKIGHSSFFLIEPNFPSLEERGSDHALLSYDQLTDEGSVYSYRIESTSGGTNLNIDCDNEASLCFLEDLLPVTCYEARLMAFFVTKETGEEIVSSPSEPLTLWTNPEGSWCTCAHELFQNLSTAMQIFG